MSKWTRAAVAAFISVLFSSSAAFAAENPALAHASALFDKGDYKGAVSELNAVLSKDPKNARALVLRGDAQDNLGHPEAALADYDSAIDINPDYEYAYATRCGTQNELGNYRDAVSDCTHALGLVPKDDYALRGRSFAYFMLDDYTLAATDADNAIAIDASNPYNMLARCRANVWLNKLDVALPACNTYIERKPDDAGGYFYRGRGEMIAGKVDLARTDFQHTLQIDTTYTSADYWLSIMELQQKRYPASLQAANAFLTRNPDDPDILLVRASAEAASGQKDAAKNDALRSLHQYQIQNDMDGAKNAQAVLDALGKG